MSLRTTNCRVRSDVDITDFDFSFRKMNRELMHEMEQRSIRELAQSEEIFKMNQERRVLKAHIMKDAVTISELKKKLENIESAKSN